MKQNTISESIGDAAVIHVITHGVVCADDIHAMVDLSGVDRRVIGMVLRRLVQHGILKARHYIKSTRAACHHRPILLFEQGYALRNGVVNL